MCALRRENALAQSSPLYRSQGHISRRSAQAESRNGGEHAWSFVRISRAFDLSSSPGCIGREQTDDKRAGRPKNASTGPGLSDVDISCNQPSRRQKFATVPEEISSARCREKPAICRRLVTPISQRFAGKGPSLLDYRRIVSACAVLPVP